MDFPAKIMISRSHKMGEGAPDMNWVISVPFAPDAMYMHEVDGVSMMSTTRNYYYGKTSDKKIHYQHMSNEKSSSLFYRDVYVEVVPGIYGYMSICTDSSIEDVMQNCSKKVKNITVEFRKAYQESLVLFDKNGRVDTQCDEPVKAFAIG